MGEDGARVQVQFSEEITKKIEMNKSKLGDSFDDLVCSVVDEIARHTNGMRKELEDAQWFLGEERTRRQQLEAQLDEKSQYIHKMEEYLQRQKQHYDEAQWYLGEERGSRHAIEQTLQATQKQCQELAQQLEQSKGEIQSLQSELRNAQWYLGEERARRESLETQLKSIQH
jgi:chromosome segregation ATPase